MSWLAVHVDFEFPFVCPMVGNFSLKNRLYSDACIFKFEIYIVEFGDCIILLLLPVLICSYLFMFVMFVRLN